MYATAKANLGFFVENWLFEVYTAIAMFALLILHVLHVTIFGDNNLIIGALIIFFIILLAPFLKTRNRLFPVILGLVFVASLASLLL